MKLFVSCVVTAISMLWVFQAGAEELQPLRPGEGVSQDPVSGNYTAMYWDEDVEKIVSAKLEVASKIRPEVNSKLHVDAKGIIVYSYSIHNGKKAGQPICDFDIDVLPVNIRLVKTDAILGSDGSVLIEFFNLALRTPKEGWKGMGVRNAKELGVGWMCDSWDDDNDKEDTQSGIKPGKTQAGFGFASPDLPGVFTAKLMGNAGFHQFMYPGHSPDPDTVIARKMYEIEANDHVSYNVAAPMIFVPSPFDPAIVLENLRTHVATWPDKQLADAAFASELDRNLQAAANAYRTGQSQEAREYIEILFGAIRRDHKDIDREDDDEEHDGKRGDKDDSQKTNAQRLSIDRLAARVLDFDLKYVLKRVREEGKDHDGKGRDGREHKKER